MVVSKDPAQADYIMHNDPRFTVRSCPACNSKERHILFDLKAEQFCVANWTYLDNFDELLQIPKDARFPIDECVSCGFVYARLLPSPDFLLRVYDKVISYKKCREGSENRISYAARMHYIATLLELTPQREPLKVLDFGCGLGISLRLLTSVNVEAVGYDPSPLRRDYVQKTRCEIFNDEQKLSTSGPYDIVICESVLEHVPEPMRTLELIASLCTNGSVLYISVPSYEKTFIKEQLGTVKKGLPVNMTLNPWEHLNYFNQCQLDRMLRICSFGAVKSSELPGHVNIGLRPEHKIVSRLKNSMASALRLVRYAALGRSQRSINASFYRFSGRP